MALNTPSDMVKQASTLSILWGVLLIVAGFVAIGSPYIAAVAVNVLLSWLLVMAGVFHLFLAFHAFGAGSMLWKLLVGLAYIGFGIYLVLHPAIGVASLTLVLSSLFLIEGVLDIILYTRIRALRGSVWVLLDGIITLLLGLMIYTQWPSSSQWAIGTLVGASMLAIGTVIAWGTHTLLVSLNQLFISLEGPSDFILPPQTAIWWFLPGFAALALAWEATLGTWSLIGNKNEVALYNYWTTAKAGFDSTRVLRIMVVVIVLPIAIATALALPQHAVLQEEAIHARGYGLSSTSTYRYVDARRLTVVDGFRQRDGKVVKRAGIVLDFADGRRWSSAAISNFEPTVDPELLNYIRIKTGLEPQYVEAESDIPGTEQK